MGGVAQTTEGALGSTTCYLRWFQLPLANLHELSDYKGGKCEIWLRPAETPHILW